MIRIQANEDRYKFIRYHDYFNLVTLPIIVFFDLLSIFYGISKNDIIQSLLLFYFFVDFIWIIYEPRSVGQVTPIAFHHIISSAAWYFSTYNYSIMEIGRIYLLVEINTFFNLLKRYVKFDFIYFIFYVTWVFFRIFLNSHMVYKVFLMCIDEYLITATFFNIYSFFLFCSLSILCLNMKWSYDLVTKKGFLGVSSLRN